MFTRRKQNEAVPEIGAEAPQFNLPSAQGGQLRLSMRTVRGPVVVAFYRPGNDEDVEWFKGLAEKEQEINLASASGRPSPDELLEKVSAITGLPKKPEEKKPAAAEDAADGEKPKKMSAEEREKIKVERRAAREAGQTVKTPETSPAAPGTAGGDQPKKMSKEERERIKAERRAARESGKSLKTDAPGAPAAGAGSADAPAEAPAEAPKKMSAEERERIKAERRAARQAGKSLKTNAPETAPPAEAGAGAGGKADEAPAAPPKMSKEERGGDKNQRRPG